MARRLGALALLAAGVTTPVAAQFGGGAATTDREAVDTATISRIKTEALEHSQIMDIVSWLTDVYGPRLTWSPNIRKAGDWAVSTMKGWGLSNVHTESWSGGNGLGWANERFSFNAVSPNPFIVQAVPRAWSAGTAGRVTGPAVRIEAACLAELKQKYAGKLKNAFLLTTAPHAAPVNEFEATAVRYSDSTLFNLAFPGGGGGRGGFGRGNATAPALPAICQPSAPAQPAPPAGGRGGFGGGFYRVTSDTATLRWFQTQGVGAILLGGSGRSNSIGGDIATDNGASRVRGAPQVPFVHVGTESYGRIARMLERNVPVQLELDMQNRFYPADSTSFNILGEIPGTDPALKDEVVMIGGHFDSWHSATGATDNAAGSAVMMEAMRVLKALNVQPRRTIRIALWTGEEQGLYGSRAYTRQHYGACEAGSFKPTDEQAKFAAYFNVDNGSGRIRGVYLQGIEAERPIFDAWMGPFKALGMKAITGGNTGGTDHLSYIGVGLPGFQFIQDPLDYGSRTHHTNQDVYERVQPDDMMFNAAVVASFAWQAAQRDEKLPRPPVPTCGGGRGGFE